MPHVFSSVNNASVSNGNTSIVQRIQNKTKDFSFLSGRYVDHILPSPQKSSRKCELNLPLPSICHIKYL